MRKIVSNVAISAIFLLGLFSCAQDTNEELIKNEGTNPKVLELPIVIPPGGNSWVVNDVNRNQSVISDEGIHNWNSVTDVIRTYFKTTATGEINVGLKLKLPSGTSTIKVTVGGVSKEIKIETSSSYKIVEAGVFKISEAGYNYVEIQGVTKSGTYIADVSEILIGGKAAPTNGVSFVKGSFYWGRRGPSLHLRYESPSDKNVVWFYNEITVPTGEDAIGSYFMANGFGQGYFGMQVNSATERKILFSVWSPYDTQNPADIPDDYKIILLGKGEGVTAKEFGNEGSGGQSFKTFDWKAGSTYKFLLKGEPSVNNSTDYSAYFYAAEVGEWKLIASFRRPHTTTYLTNLHSFLENFYTERGVTTRRGNYGNQWVYSTDKTWKELTKATFTGDGTAQSGDRLDFTGGSEGNIFLLRNCGFFNSNTKLNSALTRTASGTAPTIDFSKLEVPSLPAEPTYISKTGWKVVNFSSEEAQGEGSNGFASLVIDGSNATYWHSCWSGSCDTKYPHHITVDMLKMTEVSGFTFVQRNGARHVKEVEVMISNNNVDWTILKNFSLVSTSSPQQIDLSQKTSFRYFKFIAKSSHDGTQNASMTEISPYVRN